MIKNNSILFSDNITRYSIIFLSFLFIILIFYNLSYTVPGKARISSIEMKLPVIPVDSAELSLYEQELLNFEREQLLKHYNERGIYTKDQKYEGMITPSREER